VSPEYGIEGATLDQLQRDLAYVFREPTLLAGALTHASVAGLERGRRPAAGSDSAITPAGGGPPVVVGGDYERLEFLGDRVLGLVIAEWLVQAFPGEPEGSLAKRHAQLVRRETLCRVANEIRLGDYLRLSPGEASAGGRANPTILADACEALIGALYLDGGLEIASAFIHRGWASQIGEAEPPPRDCKTSLQEWAQGHGRPLPVYRIVQRSGPAHDPEFEVCAQVEGLAEVTARGRSRRAAEQAAARLLLRQVGAPVDD